VFFKVIMRETKKGINLKVKHANRQHPFGFKELEGDIQSDNEEEAAMALKQILLHALTQAGLHKKATTIVREDS